MYDKPYSDFSCPYTYYHTRPGPDVISLNAVTSACEKARRWQEVRQLCIEGPCTYVVCN